MSLPFATLARAPSVLLLFACSVPFPDASAQEVDAAQTSEVLRSEQVQNEDQQERIATLIQQLGDPSFQRRMQAEWELQRLGLSAFEQLFEAAFQSTNIEIANAADYLIQSQSVVWYLETCLLYTSPSPRDS